MSLFLVVNGPAPTTAAQAAVTTGTAIKTMLQVKPLLIARIVEWGISFDGSAAATPIKVELMEADVAATVTASAEGDVTKFDDGVAADAMTLSTSGTGYTATAEGTITAVRPFDVQFIAPTNQYVKQFPLGREPKIQKNKFARIRVHAGAAVNAYCYMVLDI
jgi:hypothetical protein